VLAGIALLVAASAAVAVPPGADGPIAFSRQKYGEPSELWVSNPDGSHASLLRRGAFPLTWSPDGRRLFYQWQLRELWLVNVYTGAHELVSRDWPYGYLRIAPAGDRMAFSRTGRDIRVAGADGTGEIMVVDRDLPPGGVVGFDLSPDGSSIVYAVGTQGVGRPELRIVGADGAGDRLLFATPTPGGQVASPSWSPDGGQIAFTAAYDASGLHIELIEPDGTGRVRIPNTEGGGGPFWSPSASKLAFGTAAGEGTLWTINRDGSGLAAFRVGGGARPGGSGSFSGGNWGSGPLLTRQPPPPPDAKAVSASLVRGRVLIKRRGARGFTVLREDTRVPYGSQLDARRGRVRIVADAGAGKLASADFYAGVFRLVRGKAVTELVLTGRLEGCGRASVATRRKGGRGLWGEGHGRFRTRGRRSAATVTGTKWLVQDRCDGSTFTRVAQGNASVRDFRRSRTVRLATGERYSARP
jgi:hypothetical protein